MTKKRKTFAGMIQPAAKELSALLNTPKKVAILMHPRPDGDAMGSSLGLSGILKAMGHQTTCISPTIYPAFLNWMQGSKGVKVFHGKGYKHTAAVETAITEAEVIFCLDFNHLGRLDRLGELVEAANAKKVMIDHHLEPDDFADITISDIKASSTAEVLFEVIQEANWQDHISEDVANALYTGIVTDTGCFQFSSTTARVHEITAQLLKKGANPTLVYDQVYNSFSKRRLRFFGHCIKNRMRIIDHKVGIIGISKEDIERFNIQPGDTEGLVNYPMKVGSVKATAMFKEDEGKIKISFRSKGDVDVNAFARKHFNGGGHKNAAGGASTAGLEETIDKFIANLADLSIE